MRLRERFERWRLFGRQASLIPTEELMHDGPATYREFRDNGREFVRHYVELAGLKPSDRILDVGSGIGRKTFALVEFLNEQGSYVGLDPVAAGVEWCAAHYTPRYPSFTFQHVDVRNGAYNPTGAIAAAEYRFPFEDNEFDLVVLNSVFTHMLPADVEHYMAEIARVLRVGGRCLISWFLLNAESTALIQAGLSTLNLRHPLGPARAVRDDRPEEAIGYDEAFVLDLYRHAGLDVASGPHYGSWCGRDIFVSYQDLIVAYRPDGPN
jgi:SAM-dependent methyltransferase